MNTAAPQADELIVGYDAREYWQTFDHSWPEQRKQGFLYRRDILKPLSVDVRVWPSIFSSELRPEPPERFGFQHSWSFLDDLKNAVSRYFQQQPMRAWRMIAITLMQERKLGGDPRPWSSFIPDADPSRRGADWLFLGYDICDQYGLSGLTNCGFLPQVDDVLQLRATWGPRLNRFHLFDQIEDAFAFKGYADVRMKDDHAPFFVFGLWMIR